MKRFYFMLSVIGLMVSSYLFWSSFFSMNNSNDAIYTTLEGIIMVVSIFCISLTKHSVYGAFRGVSKFRKRS